MAGIKFLEKNDILLNWIANKLIEPEIRKTWFDDAWGMDQIKLLLEVPNTLIYGLYEKGIHIPFGIVMFIGVVPHRNAELRAVIFDKENRGKGKMKEVIGKIKEDFLLRTSVHGVSAYTAGKNPQSEKFLKHLGFEKIGTKKEYLKINGKFVDSHLYYWLNKVEEK